MEKDIRTLRGKVNSVEACAQRFKEAEGLHKVFLQEKAVFLYHILHHTMRPIAWLSKITWTISSGEEENLVSTILCLLLKRPCIYFQLSGCMT